MNIVNKLTLRHLKQNKSRSVVTTLGICVSVAMITAVFVAAFSLMNLFGDLSIIQDGNWHANTFLSAQQFEKFRNDERIDKIGIEVLTDDSYFVLNDKGVPTQKSLYINREDKWLMDMVVQSSYEGRLPENGSEVIINRNLLERNFPGVGLGGKITLAVPDGFSDEKEVFLFDKKNTVSYTVVGIMNNNQPRYFITLASTADIARAFNKNQANVYFTLKKLDYNSIRTINAIDDEYKITAENGNIQKNTDLLTSRFALSSNSFFLNTLLPLCAICLVLIIIASVMLIYNAFGMSLSERVRYLGMLASVGATKKQKRASVYFEGLLLGAIGIPVGIVAGFVGIAITLYFVGDKIISSGVLSESSGVYSPA